MQDRTGKKKKDLPEITIIPPNVVKETGKLIDSSKIEKLAFWERLSPAKQETLREEVRQLAAAAMMHKFSGLAMGKHIRAIYDTCEPYSGAFRKLMTSFDFVERTAYRYMETYDNARNKFHENIIKAAMARGVNFLSHSKDLPFGKYTEVVRLLPPPPNPDEQEADRYVIKLKQTQQMRKKELAKRGERETPVVVRDRRELLKDNYRSIRNALKTLRANQRKGFLDSLFGMALTELGVSSKTWFEPEAIPEDFRQGPGYPKGRPRNPVEEAIA